jgi:hypothetical protein
MEIKGYKKNSATKTKDSESFKLEKVSTIIIKER